MNEEKAADEQKEDWRFGSIDEKLNAILEEKRKEPEPVPIPIPVNRPNLIQQENR